MRIRTKELNRARKRAEERHKARVIAEAKAKTASSTRRKA